ncbi:homeobox protein Meis1-like [Hydractinia symbiolongicarpus]|uniref:homeobox protein Meis1-like n=1 Tax=Hydractinia symbiolongicarpus TaxID=13093 RepID=UPI0025519A74|nr:homeobox protein Meis1-like [Hydractinia symbiolongicarpus]
MDRRVTSDFPSPYGLSIAEGQNPDIPPPEIDECANLSAFSTTHTERPQTQEEIDLQLKKDKENIYNHPLFPLLVRVFEKCERATLLSRNPDKLDNSNEICTSQSFSDDIEAFSKQHRADKPIFTTNTEMDNLLIQAIQVLRFHLLEIEKVHELCDNFCKRYIDCLKGKMPLDLIIEDGEKRDIKIEKMDENEDEVTTPKSISSPTPQASTWSSVELSSCSVGNTPKTVSVSQTTAISSNHHSESSSCTQLDSGPPSGASSDNMPESENDPIFKDEEDEKVKTKTGVKKRGIFPKMATNIMKAWLFQHLTHPYPSEEQKRGLANETGLTILQVNNWFINARRRIVQPMIDASNRAGKSPVVTVYKRKRKNSGSESISPGPYTYPPMPGHYTPPYMPEHYQPMYPPYHNDVALPPPPPPQYSPYGCRSDQHPMTQLPSTSCSQMRPHPTYGGYRPAPSPTPQSYFGHSHTTPMMPSPGSNLHGYHQSHPSSLTPYAPPAPHPYQPHDNLQHGVMDMHSS